MDPTALANLLAQLLPIGINLYMQIQKQYADQIPPLETILANSDANWQSIIDAANVEINKGISTK